MATEVEETLKRLVSHKAVIGTIVVNYDGIPIKSTMDPHATTQYSGILKFVKTSHIKDIGQQNFSLQRLMLFLRS